MTPERLNTLLHFLKQGDFTAFRILISKAEIEKYEKLVDEYRRVKEEWGE